MPKYIYQWRYSSGLGSGNAGDEIELTAEEAAQFNVDSPGVLALAGAKAETRSVDEPPADRMVKSAEKRGDREPAEPIDKTVHKAVKNP